MAISFAMKTNCFVNRHLPYLFSLSVFLSLTAGCASRVQTPHLPSAPAVSKPLALMGYSIQLGAFSTEQRAIRFTRSLKKDRLDAFYFAHKSGFYKVRFGNYSTDKSARAKALKLRDAGVIHEFYIVGPNDYAASKTAVLGISYLRDELVKTAESFIGVSYLWGGDSTDEGFDCSGLTMAVYRYNGLNLPRSSKEQFALGIPVERADLVKGDLVFFSTSGVKKISHVGIYIGNDKFIHAPGPGKKICVASLSQRYFAERFVEGRGYL